MSAVWVENTSESFAFIFSSSTAKRPLSRRADIELRDRRLHGSDTFIRVGQLFLVILLVASDLVSQKLRLILGLQHTDVPILSPAQVVDINLHRSAFAMLDFRVLQLRPNPETSPLSLLQRMSTQSAYRHNALLHDASHGMIFSADDVACRCAILVTCSGPLSSCLEVRRRRWQYADVSWRFDSPPNLRSNSIFRTFAMSLAVGLPICCTCGGSMICCSNWVVELVSASPQRHLDHPGSFRIGPMSSICCSICGSVIQSGIRS